MKVKNEIESKYPGLYKTLSKLKSYVKGNSDVLESMSDTSGYSKVQLLKLLSLGNLVNLVRVGDTGDGAAWGIFRSAWPGLDFDPYHVYIRENLVTSLDNGGYKDNLGANESVYGASFVTGVTVLHELVHYGRFWNGLSQDMTFGSRSDYEAGQVFETWSFGQIQGIRNSTENAKKNGW